MKMFSFVFKTFNIFHLPNGKPNEKIRVFKEIKISQKNSSHRDLNPGLQRDSQVSYPLDHGIFEYKVGFTNRS